MPPINEALLEEKLEQLESVASWSPRVISKLESFIRNSDDYDLFRVDPLHYAADKGLKESEAIDLFLHASKLVLFELEWNLICACCGLVFTSLRTINNASTHFICDSCRMESHVQLDDYIHVTFTISSSIRNLKFNDPTALDAVDYMYKFRMQKGIRREPGRGPLIEFNAKHTLVLQMLEPGEKLVTQVAATPGLFYVGDMFSGQSAVLQVTSADDTTQGKPIRMTFGSPDLTIENLDTSHVNMVLNTGHGEITFDFTRFVQVSSGHAEWTFENNSNNRVCVWALDPPADVVGTWLEIPPFFTGKRLLTTQTFRNLYRSEVLDTDEGLGIRDITFLFTDLKGSTAMYDRLGDLKAYHLVRQHFDELNKVIVQNSGAVVKTIGDAVMATFNSPTNGMQAALDIQNAINEFNKGHAEELVLKIGIHNGHSIAVTLNDRLDYFGQTVNIAARVQQLAEANEIYISQDVFSSNGVDSLLESHSITPLQANVKGVMETLKVYKVTGSRQ